MVNRSRFKEPYKRARILAVLWEEVNLQKKKKHVLLHHPVTLISHEESTHLSREEVRPGTGREAGLGHTGTYP
jgi:hypothetical protein